MLALGCVTAASAGLWATPASAHSGVLASSPAPGSTVGGEITHIDIVFDAGLTNARLTLADPDDLPVDGTMAQNAPTWLSFDMEPIDAEGQYIVRYEFDSADGDRTSSAFAFTYLADAPQPMTIALPEAVSAEAESSEAPWLRPALLIGAIAMAAAISAFFRRDRGPRNNVNPG